MAVTLAAGLTVLAPKPVFAGPIGTSETFAITSDHCTGGCLGGLASAGTVTVSQSAINSLSFSVALLPGFDIIGSGFDASFGFSLNGDPTITYSAIANNGNNSFKPNGGTKTGAQRIKIDGFGQFEYGLSFTGKKGNHSTNTSLSFTITGSGLTLDSLQQNAFPTYFAVDVFSSGTGNTGALDASSITPPPVNTPEPASMMLLGGGLAALGLARSRRSVKRG